MTHIREIQQHWLEEHRIARDAGWFRRALHSIYVYLMLPSDDTGPG